MAIEGVSRKAIPYVPEEERTVTEDQTVVWIRPKTGHQANVTMRRYAGAGREGRKGYRDLNVQKLDSADMDEFLDIVEKFENYKFSPNYPELRKQGLIKEVTDAELLRKISLDISSDLLIEIFEVSNNMSALKAGEKKDSSSSPTLPSGKVKTGKE